MVSLFNYPQISNLNQGPDIRNECIVKTHTLLPISTENANLNGFLDKIKKMRRNPDVVSLLNYPQISNLNKRQDIRNEYIYKVQAHINIAYIYWKCLVILITTLALTTNPSSWLIASFRRLWMSVTSAHYQLLKVFFLARSDMYSWIAPIHKLHSKIQFSIQEGSKKEEPNYSFPRT